MSHATQGTVVEPVTPAGPAPAARLPWIDYARGIAISLVVWGHCYRGLAEAGYVPRGGILQWADGVIYSFHNPVFFFLSGVLSGRVSALSARRFWMGRMAALAWPYLLWMSVALAIMTVMSGYTNVGALPVGLRTYLYDPISPFWFLYALLLANLFVYVFGRFGDGVLLALAGLAYAAGEAGGAGVTPSVSWGVFYVALGAVCTGWVRQPSFIQAISRPATVVVLGAGTLAASTVMLRSGYDDQVMVPAALLGCAFVFGLAETLARAARQVPPFRVVGVLGRISLTVLVTHVPATAGTRILLGRVLHLQAGWLFDGAVFSMGLAVPLLVQQAGGRLGVLRLAGLARA